jgi:hypothetical protein
VCAAGAVDTFAVAALWTSCSPRSTMSGEPPAVHDRLRDALARG